MNGDDHDPVVKELIERSNQARERAENLMEQIKELLEYFALRRALEAQEYEGGIPSKQYPAAITMESA